MAISIENSRRRIVPRWRKSSVALKLGELDPADTKAVASAPPGSFLLDKKREWLNNRKLLFATDFLGAAFAMGHSEIALDAAEFIFDKRSGASALANAIAKKVLGIPTPSEEDNWVQESADQMDIRKAVRVSKKKRIDQPRNAFVWADLARLYIALGLQEQAKKTMQIAYSLAPSNRFILRSAVRLELHLNQPEKAHFLLRNSEMIQHDPWLLASEIAICSVLEKKSKLLNIGQRMVLSGSQRPFHISELASALASTELWSGNNKRAKKLFVLSLQDPNDNSIAQAVWANRYIPIVNLDKLHFYPVQAFEAEALKSYFEGKWKKSLDISNSWLKDEPFSRRPALHMSFLASEIFEDFQQTVNIVESSLKIVPKDPSLLNNLAFAKVNLGMIGEAKKALSGIDLENCPKTTKICAIATSGLIEFHSGNSQKGKILYQAAIALASRESMPLLKTRAMLYLAREEFLQKASGAIELFREALHDVQRLGDPVLKLQAHRLENLFQ